MRTSADSLAHGTDITGFGSRLRIMMRGAIYFVSHIGIGLAEDRQPVPLILHEASAQCTIPLSGSPILSRRKTRLNGVVPLLPEPVWSAAGERRNVWERSLVRDVSPAMLPVCSQKLVDVGESEYRDHRDRTHDLR